MPEEKIEWHEFLEYIAKIAGYKGVSYEIGPEDIKDGRPYRIRNLKIVEIDLIKLTHTKL